MPSTLPTFHGWEDKPKRYIFDQFLDRYDLRGDQDQNKCQEVLEKIAANGYGRALRNARKRCIRKVGNDTNKWKQMAPKWCKVPKCWPGLCDYYGSEDYQNLAAKNRDNRCRSGRLVVHFGGSRSAVAHAEKLEKELGRKPTGGELYVRVHTKQKKKKKGRKENVVQSDGEDQYDSSEDKGEDSEITDSLQFADQKSKEAYEQVQEMILDPANVDKPDTLLYIEVEALGGKKNGRIPGFDNQVDETIIPTANKCARPNHYSGSTISSACQQGKWHSDAEVQAMMDEKDKRHEELLPSKGQAPGVPNPQEYSTMLSGVPNQQGFGGSIPSATVGQTAIVPPILHNVNEVGGSEFLSQAHATTAQDATVWFSGGNYYTDLMTNQ